MYNIFYVIKIIGHHACLREKEHLLVAIELTLREISYVFYKHALMCAR